MGSIAELRVDGRYVGASKNTAYDRWLLVFSADDRIADGPTPDGEIVAFENSASVVADRLDLLGATLRQAQISFMVAVNERVDTWTFSDLSDSTPIRLTEEIEGLEGYGFEDWCADFSTSSADFESDAFRSLSWLVDLWNASDPLHLLRAAVAAVPAASTVRLDLTDLVHGGWVDARLDPRSAALLLAQASSAEGLPIVVLTEGRSDSEVLELALRVIYPHLVGYLRFPDFLAASAEGGASALVRTVRAFAASGIANRVVALFDNDAAGAEAVIGLNVETLPPNLKILQLPEIDLARSYPTVGPLGPANADVNGSAAALELYMGRDILSDARGALRPVVWGGRAHKVGRYQGEVFDKHALHGAFRTKAKAALADRSCMTRQDWDDMRLVLDAIRSAFA